MGEGGPSLKVYPSGSVECPSPTWGPAQSICQTRASQKFLPLDSLSRSTPQPGFLDNFAVCLANWSRSFEKKRTNVIILTNGFRIRDTATHKAPSGKTLLTSCLFTFESNFQLHFRLECILCYTKMNPFAFLGAGPTRSTERRWGGRRVRRRDAKRERVKGKSKITFGALVAKQLYKERENVRYRFFLLFICF